MKQKLSFVKVSNLSHWYGFVILMFSLLGHMGKKNLRSSSMTLTNIILILNLLMSLIEKVLLFWILKVPCQEVIWPQTYTLSLQTGNNICTLHLHIQHIPYALLFSAKPWGSVEYVYMRKIYEKHMGNMGSWFPARGYHKHLVQKEMKKIKFTKVNRVKRKKETKGATFIVTYHPLLKPLQSLINKHLNIFIDKQRKKLSYLDSNYISYC